PRRPPCTHGRAAGAPGGMPDGGPVEGAGVRLGGAGLAERGGGERNRVLARGDRDGDAGPGGAVLPGGVQGQERGGRAQRGTGRARGGQGAGQGQEGGPDADRLARGAAVPGGRGSGAGARGHGGGDWRDGAAPAGEGAGARVQGGADVWVPRAGGGAAR